ncbi:MAG: DUF885 family protein [Polyangia bacterium]
MSCFELIRRSAPLALAVSLLASACYTLEAGKKKEESAARQASTELHGAIYDYVEQTLYTYPERATLAGMHVYELPNGEKVSLDRELPNYSADLVAARVEKLESYLERLDAKAPAAALSPNDRADRKLLVDGITAELHLFRELEAHTDNPLIHVLSLARAIHGPLALEYASEEKRLSDLLGRLNWVPSYVERTIKTVTKSSDVLTAAAAEINAATLAMVRGELASRVKEKDELSTGYDGMKKPVLDALEKLQVFLEKDLPERPERTWRLGRDRYVELCETALHTTIDPDELESTVEREIDQLRREMFSLARPFYCEHNQEDRDVCGPTPAEIAAAKKAEQERRRKEEEKRARAEEKRRKKEEQKQARAEEERRKKEKREREKKEKKKDKEKIDNPYEIPSEQEEEEEEGDEEGIANPYALRIAPDSIGSAGAKLAGDDDQDEEDGGTDEDVAVEEGEDGEVDDAAVERVVAFALKRLGREGVVEPAGIVGEIESRFESLPELAERRGVLDSCDLERLRSEKTPRFLAALGLDAELVPQPVFQPEQGATAYVLAESPIAGPPLDVLTFQLGAPGKHEALRRALEIEPQTRRAIRLLAGDPTFVEGWGLYSALSLTRAAEGEEAWKRELLALAAVLRAAVGLCAEVRLHAGDTGAEEAAAQLEERAWLSPDEADRIILLARTWPGRLTAPYLGYRFWSSLRQKVEEASEHFDQAEFHELVLSFGPVPIGLLPELLAAEDPDAQPSDVAEPEDDGQEEKSTFSILDIF